MSATLAFEENINNRRLILLLVKKLQQNIPYQIWNNIITLLDDENYIKVIEEKLIVHNALKLYCENKYDECASECRKQLEIYSNNISQTVDKIRDIRCGLFSRKELKSQYLQARL